MNCNALLRLGVSLILLVAVLLSVGCSPRSTPPGGNILRTSTAGMHITYLQWKEGLSVLIVDDLNGDRFATGTGSTENPVHSSVVKAGSKETGEYSCQLETRDGKSGKCMINGSAYDLSKGTLFVIKARGSGNQVDIHQLHRDLAKVPYDVEGCAAWVGGDAEIRKLMLGADNLPQ